jgi:hypothetical protein
LNSKKPVIMNLEEVIENINQFLMPKNEKLKKFDSLLEQNISMLPHEIDHFFKEYIRLMT